MLPLHTRAKKRAGFTLAEVMITLVLVSLLCLGVLGGLQTLSRLALKTAVRSEAHRLLQAEAERLSSVAFSNFVASGNQTLTGSFRTSFLPGNEPQFSYPASGTTGRVSFTRRVAEIAATSTSRTLRVDVEWTWQGQTSVISTPLFRGQ